MQSLIRLYLITCLGARTWGKTTNLYVLLPIIEEQKLIAEYLEEKFSQFDDLKTKLVLQIEKLKEYRQAVISEAVSGKIDVRDWKLKT